MPQLEVFNSAQAQPEPEPSWEQMREPLREAMDQVNPDDLSPREALELLYRLKKL